MHNNVTEQNKILCPHGTYILVVNKFDMSKYEECHGEKLSRVKGWMSAVLGLLLCFQWLEKAF